MGLRSKHIIIIKQTHAAKMSGENERGRVCKVLSSDQKLIELSEFVWKRIPTIRNCIEDVDEDEEVAIPLAASAEVLNWINNFYLKFGDPSKFTWTDEDTENLKTKETIDKTVEDYILSTITTRPKTKPSARVYISDLLNQTNYLDAGQAMDMLSRVLADQCSLHAGDDPVKIRAFLSIEDTPVPLVKPVEVPAKEVPAKEVSVEEVPAASAPAPD